MPSSEHPCVRDRLSPRYVLRHAHVQFHLSATLAKTFPQDASGREIWSLVLRLTARLMSSFQILWGPCADEADQLSTKLAVPQPTIARPVQHIVIIHKQSQDACPMKFILHP